jgi:hypothetical protein
MESGRRRQRPDELKTPATCTPGAGPVAKDNIGTWTLSIGCVDGSIVKINEQPAFQRQGALVRARMATPVVSLGHRTDSGLMVVDPGNRMVVVPVRR